MIINTWWDALSATLTHAVLFIDIGLFIWMPRYANVLDHVKNPLMLKGIRLVFVVALCLLVPVLRMNLYLANLQWQEEGTPLSFMAICGGGILALWLTPLARKFCLVLKARFADKNFKGSAT